MGKLLLAVLASLALAGGAEARTYYATVGPSATISVRNAAGTLVRRVPRGLHTFVVRDRSRYHNFRLRGGGLNRATTVSAVRTVRWSVRIRPGVVYVYLCNPHADEMRGSFRGV